MKTSDLNYCLPKELVAQEPCEPRDAARMLVLDRSSRSIHADIFQNLAHYLQPGDCIVLNDTRVIPARLHGLKPTGGKVEVFLLQEDAPGIWQALVRPAARAKPGTLVRFAGGREAVVGEALPGGRRLVRFGNPDVLDLLERVGEVPLPPYVRREPNERDRTRYQTIYARAPGAVAAPTAGLHFTPRVLDSLDAAGVRRAFLTLHVSYGTFRPVQAETLEEHRLEAEPFEFPQETAAILNQTRREGGRIVAVGTTTTRVLETQYRDGAFRSASGGFTDRFIYPPYQFAAVDVLQTNFHLPRSTLLALVCAFAGTEFVLEAYRFAVKERFRFYSYGDVMLIL